MRANEGPRKVRHRSTKAHSGQRRPTKANAGPHVSALCMFFFVFCSKLTILYKFYLAGRRPTQADEGPQQPMTANAGTQRQLGAQTTRLPSFGPLHVFFSNVPSICYFFI